MASQRICKIDGCDKPVSGRGWCVQHYSRWRRNGDPLALVGRAKPTLRWLEEHVNHDGDGCLIWPFATLPSGYGKVHFRGGQGNACRAMCILAHGEPPTPEHETAHSCGRGANGCVHPGHVRWATRAENMLDRVEHGSGNRGETHYRAKLSEDDVRRIRSLATVKTQAEISAMFGIDPSHVSGIVNRKRWAWLT
jgi:hypothetical protein